MKLNLNILSLLLLLSGTAFATHAENYTLTPGSLPRNIEAIRHAAPTEITLSGVATQADLGALRKLPASVKTIDMSNLEIDGVPDYCLISTKVERVVLPSGITSIGRGAFASTPLKNINLPASVTQIGDHAFYRCENLGSIDLSSTSLQTLPSQCFYGCNSLKSLKLPSSMRKIDERSLMSTSLTQLNLSMADTIGNYALANIPTLTEVSIKETAHIGEGAFFDDTQLSSLGTMPKTHSPLSLANTALSDMSSSLKAIDIEEGAFANLQADSLILSGAVNSIGRHAFLNATRLKKVDVTELGETPPTVDPEAFAGVNLEKVQLWVAGDSQAIWASAPVWKEFTIISASTGIADADQNASDINIRANGDYIFVESPRPITSVRVYSDSGSVLTSVTPGISQAKVGPFEHSSILIVEVFADNIRTIAKIKI